MGAGRSSERAGRDCSARGDLFAPQSPRTPNSRPRDPGLFRLLGPKGAIAGGDNCKPVATASTCPAAPGPAAPTGHHHCLPRLLHCGMQSLGSWRWTLERTPERTPTPEPRPAVGPRPLTLGLRGHAPDTPRPAVRGPAPPRGFRRAPRAPLRPRPQRPGQATPRPRPLETTPLANPSPSLPMAFLQVL